MTPDDRQSDLTVGIVVASVVADSGLLSACALKSGAWYSSGLTSAELWLKLLDRFVQTALADTNACER